MIETPGLSIKALKKEPYSGSFHGMRYYYVAKDDVLYTYIYSEPWAFDAAPEEDKLHQEYPFTEDGLADAMAWMQECYDNDSSKWLDKERDRMKIFLEKE